MNGDKECGDRLGSKLRDAEKVTWRNLHVISRPVVEILVQCLMTTGSGIYRIFVPSQLALETYPIVHLELGPKNRICRKRVGRE